MNRRVTVALVAALCLASHGGTRVGPVAVQACGPFPPPYPFARAVVPDAMRYSDGQLGIVQPLFARRYLLVAWRYLNGIPLTDFERSALTVALPNAGSAFSADPAPEPVDRWLAARAAVAAAGAAPTQIRQWKPAPNDAYPYYFNCPNAAFEAAADTLALFIKQYGVASRITIDWAVAQDRVFERCAENAPKAAPIADLAADAPAFARGERRYQMAAAAFYDGNWDAAERGFRAIAADSESRWRPWGQYLAARTLVRRATLTPGASAPFDPNVLAAAERELRAVVKEASIGRVRTAAERMLRYVELRTQPDSTVLAVARQLQRPRQSGSVATDFDEYRYLLDRLVGDTVDYSYDSIDARSSVRQQDDMTDWILTYQASGAGALQHALGRWRAAGGEPWLMAVAAKIDAGHDAMRDVLDAAARVPAQSPAFPTLAFHRARILIEAGRHADARAALDPLLAKESSWPRSTLNLFRAARLRTARSLPEFLTDAVRIRVIERETSDDVPGRVADSADGKAGSRALAFDADSTDVMNERLPLAILAAAAESEQLPEHLRRDVAIAAFTRSLLLGDDERLGALARNLAGVAPDLKEALARVTGASTPAARRTEAWHVLLRHPGLRPFVPRHATRHGRLNQLDPLRENWWCAFASPAGSGSASEAGSNPQLYFSSYESHFVRQWRHPEFLRPLYRGSAVPISPNFLSESDRAQVRRELDALARRGAAATDLAQQAVAFARGKPADPRAPEALYLGVRATRYGCTDDATGKWSKTAFELLHRQYAASTWAKRTPYWYR